MDGPKFVIQGVDYPVPEWVSFTMDESEILYERGKLTLDQADDDIAFTPGLLSALMLIAYMRGNPGLSRKAAEKVIGAIPMAEALEHLAGDGEADADPPSLAPSETDKLGEHESDAARTLPTGRNGESGSESSDVVQLPTGTHG